MDFSFLLSCNDLTEDHFAEAAESREDTYELLLRIAEISRQHDGTSTAILRFLSRVAMTSRWVDGDVRIRIDFCGMFRTRLILMRGFGGDEFEVLKRIELSVSFMEFREACKESRAIQPFIVSAAGLTGKDMFLVLDAPEQARRESVKPPAFEAAQARLAEKLRQPQIPRLKPEVAAALEKIRRLRETQEAPAAPAPRTPIAKIELQKRPLQHVAPATSDRSPRNPESLLPLIKPQNAKPRNDDRNRTRAYGVPAQEEPTTTAESEPSHDVDEGWDED